MNEKATAKPDEMKADVAGKAVEAVKEVASEAAAGAKTVVKGITTETKRAAQEVRGAVNEKKAAKGPKKNAKALKPEVRPEIFIQYGGEEAVLEDAVEKVKNCYVAEGHRVSSIKSLQLYLKPEENAAYYVINQKVAGKIDLF